MTKNMSMLHPYRGYHPTLSEETLRKIEEICRNRGLTEKVYGYSLKASGGNFSLGAPGLAGSILSSPSLETIYEDESEKEIFLHDRTKVIIRRYILGWKGVWTRKPLIGGDFSANVRDEIANEILETIPLEKRQYFEREFRGKQWIPSK